MENWCNQPTSQGTWIILGEVSWQFHTDKDKISDQTQISTFLFWVWSWRQRMEQQRTHSTMFSPSLQLKSPSTRDSSFASGQSGCTSFNKQGYTICTRTYSCQFHWCNLSFHHEEWFSGNSIHSKMIQPTKQRNTTSEVHSFQEVTGCTGNIMEASGKSIFMYIMFCLGLIQFKYSVPTDLGI